MFIEDNGIMKETDFYKEYQAKKKEAGIRFHFSDIDDSERLSYEKLNNENYSILVDLFSGDKSEFVNKRFKNLVAAKSYASEILDSVYTAKYGGCDFFVKEKSSGNYIGVIHIFDFSLEIFSDVPYRCSFGFAIAEAFRRKYYATEAINAMIKYTQLNHKKSKFLAITSFENIPAINFLKSLGLENRNEDYIYGGRSNNYFVLENKLTE